MIFVIFADGAPSCIQKEKVGRHLSSNQDQGSNDTFFIVSPSPDTKCTEDKMFIIKNESIIHIPTGRCLIPERESIIYLLSTMFTISI